MNSNLCSNTSNVTNTYSLFVITSKLLNAFATKLIPELCKINNNTFFENFTLFKLRYGIRILDLPKAL